MEIVNMLLLTGGDFVPEVHLKEPRFRYHYQNEIEKYFLSTWHGL